jgi:hypothetical protein
MKQSENLERLLYVSQVKENGDEAKIREQISRDFPKDAFERAGLKGFSVYIGGGYCVFEFGFAPPFDPIFERFNADAGIRAFFDRLDSYVDPVPRLEPGNTADEPIAADQFLWRTETGTKKREPSRKRSTTPRPRAQSPRKKMPG